MYTPFLRFVICSLVVSVQQSILCREPGDVRLVASSRVSSTATAGRVEYCYNSSSGNVWSTLCIDGWDLRAAHVACRSYRTGGSAYTTVPGDE